MIHGPYTQYENEIVFFAILKSLWHLLAKIHLFVIPWLVLFSALKTCVLNCSSHGAMYSYKLQFVRALIEYTELSLQNMTLNEPG